MGNNDKHDIDISFNKLPARITEILNDKTATKENLEDIVKGHTLFVKGRVFHAAGFL